MIILLIIILDFRVYAMYHEVHLPGNCAMQIDVDVATHIKITEDGPKRRFCLTAKFYLRYGFVVINTPKSFVAKKLN